MHKHQAIGILEGQPLEQHAVDDGKHRCVCTDAEAQREDGDSGKARRSVEQPQRVAEVLPGGGHGSISFCLRCTHVTRLTAEGHSMARRPGQHAPSLPVQPAFRGGAAVSSFDPFVFLDRVAEHPLAIRRRGGDPNDEQDEAIHHNVFRRRASPAVISAYVL